MLGRTYFHLHEVDPFLAEAEQAIALNPNNSILLASVGLDMSFVGKWDRGAELTQRAMRLSPNPPGWMHTFDFWQHYRKREYEKTVVAAETYRTKSPDFFWPHLMLAAGYRQLGRKKDAEAAAARLLELYPGFRGKARAEMRIWNISTELTEHTMDGLRKAGLEIPPP